MVEKKKYRKETYRTIWKQYSADRYGWKKKLKTSQYVKLLSAIMMRISNMIIEQQYRYHMPFNFGEIYVSKKKIKTKLINYGETKKRKETVYFENNFLRGFVPFFKWDKRTTRLANKRLLLFQPVSGWDVEEMPVGKVGLWRHIESLYRDPYKKDYEIIG